MNLLAAFVNEYFRTDDAQALLRDHGCLFDPWETGYQGGAKIRVSGRFFQHDEGGNFCVVTPVYLGPTPTLREPVENPVIADLVAWHPSNPGKWHFLRGEAGLILGERAMFEASIFGEPLRLYRTPFAWLQTGCAGSVLLDHHGLNRLYGLREVVCKNIEHGERIERGLSLFYRKNMPSISVPAVDKRQGMIATPSVPVIPQTRYSAVGAGVSA